MSHFIVLAIGTRSIDSDLSSRARDIDYLREAIDLASTSAFSTFPKDVLCSVGPSIVMLAFPDTRPDRPLQLLGALSRQIVAPTRSISANLAAVLTAGPMKRVDVLSFSTNFEGQPAIAAARILGKVREGQVLIDSSLWGFGDLVAECGPEEVLAGKHETESFRVRRHSRFRLGGASDSHPHSPNETATAERKRSGERVIETSALADLIGNNEWLVGAINFDEDLHFSSFYLRQSSQHYLSADLKRFGYSTIVSVYEDFDERYYLPQTECIRVAQELLDTIIQDPIWLQNILDEIRVRVDLLRDVFPFKETDLPFSAMSDAELLAVYRKHNAAHRGLYEVARIPEALDRGIGRFTAYLKDYLRKLSPNGLSAARDLNSVWETLTFPEEMSAVLIELSEFQQLVSDIRSSARKREVFSRPVKRALLHLDPDTRSKIIEHRKKWSFLGYHGYGSRALPDISDYVERLTRALEDDRGGSVSILDQQNALRRAEQARLATFARVGVDGIHQQLFRLHSRVGVIKLQRRYVQLRNFYYLDQLLAEIAARRGVAEATIRSLLPEEIEGVLQERKPVSAEQNRRAEFAVYLLNADGEQIFAGPEFRWVERELRLRSSAKRTTEGKIYGDPISGGVVRGRAKIVIRQADAVKVGFAKGDILVSESTDPDLRFEIAEAGGVITESGGATCHAAIYCREISKPALVGVPNLLNIVRNDDRIVLNATDGYFSILPTQRGQLVIEDTRAEQDSKARVGSKAAVLGKMLTAGLPVPRFFVVPVEIAKARLAGPTSDAAAPGASELLDEVRMAVEYLNGDLFVIRSSMGDEDDADCSMAGFYASESMVERQDVIPALVQYVEEMFLSISPQVTGGIIIQEMVLGDVSGTCFTRDPLTDDKNTIIIEAVPGGNEELTNGRVLPVHYALHRHSYEILREDTHQQWRGLLSSDVMRGLLQRALEIERLLGIGPLDIEWTAKGNKLWWLQARAITGATNKLEKARVSGAVAREGSARSIASIYRAYRVPPNLQMHLLRVAAVGAWIADHWAGPPIDRHTILSTLLLHDIGNIVKVDYDRYPALLPEEKENLQYWKAVQANMIDKYGGNDHRAALQIASELAVPRRVLELMDQKRFVENERTLESDDWELKICAYADQRVSPIAVTSLMERLSEAKERYRGVAHASVNHPQFTFLVDCAAGIERQLANHSTLPLSGISEDLIRPMLDGLRGYTLQGALVA